MKIIDFLRCHFSRWKNELKSEYNTGSKAMSGFICLGLSGLGLFGIYMLIEKLRWIGVAYLFGVPAGLTILWIISWRIGRHIDG